MNEDSKALNGSLHFVVVCFVYVFVFSCLFVVVFFFLLSDFFSVVYVTGQN